MLNKKQMTKNIVVSLLLSFGSLHAEVQKGPYLIYDGINTGMTVLWQLDSSQSCTIDWGVDTFYTTGSAATGESGSGTDEHQHKYTITGLTPGTKYFYQANCDIDSVGNGSFHTAPLDNADNVKFLVYGDTRSYPADHDAVSQEMINAYASDPEYQTITLHVGDWVNNGDVEADWADQFFDSYYTNTNEFQANMPINGVKGNHEGSGVLFKKYFPYLYEPSGFYWSFDYGPAHITVIDQYVPYTLGSTQYAWLENDLTSSTKKWKFLVFHEPGWSAGGHSNEADVQNYIQPLAIKYGVSMIFAGHNHYYARAVVDGIQHVTTGGGGAPLKEPDPDYENVVASASSHHFCEVEIQGDDLWFVARDKNGGVFDSFHLNPLADTTPPVITILGDNPLNLQVGDTYTDPGATAQDNVDGNVTASIQTSDNVNTSAAGSYNVTYMVNDAAGNTATTSRTVVVSDPPVSNDSIANSDIFVKGTVSGSYIDTHALDDIMETITERVSGGKPSNRYSYLEHVWTIQVEAGATMTLFAQLLPSNSTDGDEFEFAYSTDNNNFIPMFTISGSNLMQYSANLPANISGTLYVRVTDTDRTPGNKALDSIAVDQLYVRTGFEVGEVPAAPTALVANAISSSQIELSWSDNSDNELGFKIERFDEGNWVEAGRVGVNILTYTDTGLQPVTAYAYRISAYNGSGDSVYSNEETATTEAGAAISLSVQTQKVRAEYFADLEWSGATTQNVDIYRDGSEPNTVPNSGTYSDPLGKKPAGSYVYKVCEYGTTLDCSDEVVVSF